MVTPHTAVYSMGDLKHLGAVLKYSLNEGAMDRAVDLGISLWKLK